MKLYDECIEGIEALLKDAGCCQPLHAEVMDWPDEGKNQLIFQSDAAYELGGGNRAAVSGIAFTDKTELVPEDEIILCGADLGEIKEDTAFSRIALVRLKDDKSGDTDALYQTIRKIEYTRYHLNPKGYMMRISAMNQREVVRVGKSALTEGLDFAKVGSMFLQAYHKHPEVAAVKLIFVTEKDFPYAELSKLAVKSENITKTLDHLTKKVKMDCNACSLKEVCAEVEALCNEEKE